MSTLPDKSTPVICGDARVPESSDTDATDLAADPDRRLRLLIVTVQGSPGTFPQAWRSYTQIEDARANALAVLRNPKVLRVAIIWDGTQTGGSVNPLRLVEWVGSS